MYVDFKETIWFRVEIQQENEKEILSKLKSGEITYSSELCELTLDGGEVLYDTSEGMGVEDNDGFATVCVMNDAHEEIFANGKS